MRTGAGSLISGVEREVLPNGLTVLTRETHSTGIVAVEVLVKMGARFEPDSRAGLSVLAASCLLKGTASRSSEQIALEVESQGARIASRCGSDCGTVAVMAAGEGLEGVLEVLFDVLTAPSFPDAEVERERALLEESIRARRDDLLGSAFDLFQEEFYGKHPYHKPRLGYEKTVATFGRDDLVDFHRERFVPSNMVVSAVGHFDSRRFRQRVAESLAGLEGGAGPEAGKDEWTPPREPRETVCERKAERAWIVVGYPAPAHASPGYPAAEVMDAIVGGSMNSRLFVELREKRGLAYQVGALYAARPGPSFIAAYAGTDPRQFEEVKSGLSGCMCALASDGVEEDELERARQYLKGTFVMKQETAGAQAGMLGRAELDGLGYEFVGRYPELVASVEADDVVRVAREYLATETVAAIRPESQERSPAPA